MIPRPTLCYPGPDRRHRARHAAVRLQVARVPEHGVMRDKPLRCRRLLPSSPVQLGSPRVVQPPRSERRRHAENRRLHDKGECLMMTPGVQAMQPVRGRLSLQDVFGRTARMNDHEGLEHQSPRNTELSRTGWRPGSCCAEFNAIRACLILPPRASSRARNGRGQNTTARVQNSS